jgi:hypothetical protein
MLYKFLFKYISLTTETDDAIRILLQAPLTFDLNPKQELKSAAIFGADRDLCFCFDTTDVDCLISGISYVLKITSLHFYYHNMPTDKDQPYLQYNK